MPVACWRQRVRREVDEYYRAHAGRTDTSSVKDPMKSRLSASVALALLISAVALVGQWVSQGITADALEKTVREAEIDKVTAVSRLMAGEITRRGERAQAVASSLARNPDVVAAFSLKETYRTPVFKRELGESSRTARVAIEQVTDNQGAVLYRNYDPSRFGDPGKAWGLEETLGGASMLMSDLSPEAVVIWSLEPIKTGGVVIGTVAAGVPLDKLFFEQLRSEMGANLTLLARKGVALSDGATNAKGTERIDLSAMTEAFEKKIPIYRIDSGLRQTNAYLPIEIIDNAYVVLVRLDSAAAYSLLDDSKQRSVQYAILILIGSILVGLLALHGLMGPLRRLRQRAEIMAVNLTGESIKSKGRDEVTSVVEVLDKLTDRFLARNRELDLARSEAEAANQAKSQFLSSMSHEIRTPLNGVLGMAELLMDTPLNQDQARYVGAIKSAGQVLHGLLGDVLDLAKIEEGRVTLEKIDFDPRQIVLDVATVYREMASMGSLKLLVDTDQLNRGWVSGDPTRFRQVLSNLLGNAVKFTQRGEVRLHAQSIQPPAGDSRAWCRVSVQDTGIGIDSEAMQKLFKRFAQADVSTTREFGGSGLGLIISKHLVELMGGQIHVQSEPGAGSRFWFDLPFDAPTVAVAATPVGVDKAQMAGLRLLVAEDNQINQLVIKAMLGKLGADVTIVANGKLALEHVKKGGYDLVFMDCQMPVMDGFESARQIRVWEATQLAQSTQYVPIPVIAQTANALAGDREACLAAGMNDYVTKPVTGDTLLLQLEQHLRRRETRGLTQSERAEPSPTPVAP